MARRFLLTLVAVAALALAACGQAPAAQEQSSSAGGPIQVVASTSIIADVVSQIGGDRVAVSTLVPIGGDTHSFEPTPQDLARVTSAQVVFVNGAGYEEFLERMLESAGSQAELVELSEGIVLRELGEGEEAHAEGEEAHAEGEEAHAEGEEAHAEGEEAHAEGEEHGHSGLDPHTWTDPNNVKYWTQGIVETLSRLDAAGADFFKTNAERYNTQLTELDTWIAEQFAQLPPERRLLVTDHAVFGYMADRYGLRQVGTILPGYSSAAAPSAQELAELQREIAELQVPAIFVGDVVGQNLGERIAEDTGTELVTILTESLTPPNGPGATYIDYMRHNVSTMVDALR